MMVPALAALSLRVRQAARLAEPGATSRAIVGAAFVEGLLWAAAFWVKPHRGGAGAARAGSCRRGWPAGRPRFTTRRVRDPRGRLVAGAAGVAWLVASGAWPSFVEAVFVWNREYVAHDMTDGRVRGSASPASCTASSRGSLVHLVAVPVALGRILRRRAAPETLLGGFYLGWLLQSVFLQHLFDYVHVPPVLLGLTVVASWYVGHPEGRRVVLACLLVGVLLRFPSLCRERLAAWDDCVRDGQHPRAARPAHAAGQGELVRPRPRQGLPPRSGA